LHRTQVPDRAAREWRFDSKVVARKRNVLYHAPNIKLKMVYCVLALPVPTWRRHV